MTAKATIFTWMEFAARTGLCILFVYSAWGKIADPGIFANAVMRYELLPECMVGMFALTLPMVELLAGLALVFTKWLREAAFLVLMMLVMFIAALAWAILRGLEIDCGCFGVPSIGGRTELIFAVVRDVALLIPSAWLLSRCNAWIASGLFAGHALDIPRTNI